MDSRPDDPKYGLILISCTLTRTPYLCVPIFVQAHVALCVCALEHESIFVCSHTDMLMQVGNTLSPVSQTHTYMHTSHKLAFSRTHARARPRAHTHSSTGNQKGKGTELLHSRWGSNQRQERKCPFSATEIERMRTSNHRCWIVHLCGRVCACVRS